MIETKAVTAAQLADLDSLFCANEPADRCWCMWHIISVKAFHAGGAEQNRSKLTQLAQTEQTPIGILAYRDGEPKGWCAVGPRFLVQSDVRGLGVSKTLLEAAVQLASDYNAEAIDGFPFANGKRRSGGPDHAGFESTFLQCGFEPIRRPSENRVVMRRSL